MQVPIVGKGDTDLLSGVLHLPKLSYGLISIARLDIERYISIFRNGRMWVVAPSGTLLCSGTQSKGLYFLDERYREALLGGEGDVKDDAEYAAPVRRGRRLPSATLGYNDLELLDMRWAHAKERNIKHALKTGKVTDCDCTYEGIKYQHLRFCIKCWMGSMRAFDRDAVSRSVFKVLEKIGIDYKGPFSTRTLEQYKGFYLFSDQKSNFFKAYLVQSQEELLDCLKDFLERVVEQTGHVWRLLQCDRGSSNTKGTVLDWLLKQHIEIQYSAPYKHSQNGMVERDIGTVMDRARTVMSVHNSPPKYWGWAV
jgi:hypothetical protein